jgi:hypothetical protein
LEALVDLQKYILSPTCNTRNYTIHNPQTPAHVHLKRTCSPSISEGSNALPHPCKAVMFETRYGDGGGYTIALHEDVKTGIFYDGPVDSPMAGIYNPATPCTQ